MQFERIVFSLERLVHPTNQTRAGYFRTELRYLAQQRYSGRVRR
jgi:hypothetical protein